MITETRIKRVLKKRHRELAKLKEDHKTRILQHKAANAAFEQAIQENQRAAYVLEGAITELEKLLPAPAAVSAPAKKKEKNHEPNE